MKLKFKYYNDYLSSGICDNCQIPEFINTGTINEPYEEFYCQKRKIFIEPKNLNDQILECEFFVHKN
jgi:hypothetical protein